MIRTLLLAVALLACKHKTTEVAAGSASPTEGSAGSAMTGSASGSAAVASGTGNASAGSASAGSASAGSAATVAQPTRSPQDTAAVADADKAVADAMAKAHAAKTAAEACGGVDALMTKLNVLDKVTPPKGMEHEFAEAVTGLGMVLSDIKAVTCADPQSAASDIADRLDRVRQKLDAVEGIGAK